MVVLMLILDEESPLTADIKFPTCTHGWIIEKNITYLVTKHTFLIFLKNIYSRGEL